MTRGQIIFDLLDRACILASNMDHGRYLLIAKARFAFMDEVTSELDDFELRLMRLVSHELSKGGKD